MDFDPLYILQISRQRESFQFTIEEQEKFVNAITRKAQTLPVRKQDCDTSKEIAI